MSRQSSIGILMAQHAQPSINDSNKLLGQP